MKAILQLFLTLCLTQSIHAQIYDDYIGAGHSQGVTITASHAETRPLSTLTGNGLGLNLQETTRFLSQATLGADLGTLLRADSMGIEPWLDHQFSLAPVSHLGITLQMAEYTYPLYIEAGGEPDNFLINAFFSRSAWWHITMNAPDILRHKIALALSEILVISDQSDLNAFGYGLSTYYDILSENAFGNFEDILQGVTLDPSMGYYLSHMNNPKSNPALNIHPDENYAREIMQLFSIGLYELNIDGTRILDENDQYIPTYDNNDITELAKVFTGLGAADFINDDAPFEPQFGIPLRRADLTQPMAMYDEWHEPGPKTIIGDLTIPAGQTGMQDVRMAVRHIFNHPNVGPFISKQLIQRLIKSNPTPAYVRRVAETFNDNGNGERGDMQAVVRAILLDNEARSCSWLGLENHGKLREPIHRYTQLLRTFLARSDTDYFFNFGFLIQNFTEQHPMSAPSVFNFFLPDYQPNGDIADQNLVAPEFQIFNSTSSVGYLNLLHVWTILEYLNDIPDRIGLDDPTYQAQYRASELEYIGEMSTGVVDYMDLMFGHGNLSESTKEIIINSCAPLDDPVFRLKMATYLTMMSPDYNIMK